MYDVNDENGMNGRWRVGWRFGVELVILPSYIWNCVVQNFPRIIKIGPMQAVIV